MEVVKLSLLEEAQETLLPVRPLLLLNYPHGVRYEMMMFLLLCGMLLLLQFMGQFPPLRWMNPRHHSWKKMWQGGTLLSILRLLSPIWTIVYCGINGWSLEDYGFSLRLVCG